MGLFCLLQHNEVRPTDLWDTHTQGLLTTGADLEKRLGGPIGQYYAINSFPI